MARSIAFYRALGFVLIVQDAHYARFELPPDHATLSLELRDQSVRHGPHVYLECEDLDARVAALKAKGIVFDSDPEDIRWGVLRKSLLSY